MAPHGKTSNLTRTGFGVIMEVQTTRTREAMMQRGLTNREWLDLHPERWSRTDIKAAIRQEMADAGYGRGYSYEVLFNVPHDTDEGHGNYYGWADALDVAEPGDVMDVWVYQRVGPIGYQDTDLVSNVVFRVGQPGQIGYPHDSGYELDPRVVECGEPLAKQGL